MVLAGRWADVPDPTALPRLLPAAAEPGLGAHLHRLGPLPRTDRSLPRGGRPRRAAWSGRSRFPHRREDGVGRVELPLPTPDRRGERHRGRAGQREGPDPARARPPPGARRARRRRRCGRCAGRRSCASTDATSHVVESVTRALAERAGRPRRSRSTSGSHWRPAGTWPGKRPPWCTGSTGARPSPPSRRRVRSSAGVGGRPTLIDNVETLAHVALIARFGSTWFRGLGTEEEPGSVLVTVSGHAPRPGIFEVPSGMGIAALLDQAGTTLDELGAVLDRWAISARGSIRSLRRPRR